MRGYTTHACLPAEWIRDWSSSAHWSATRVEPCTWA